ncbi:cyclic-di-AMP phosphodiesterase GdpP [Paenibacillus baekrokdamisoli]|uniref:Cyclic-di-AMP phosphodiesterase n=1 Tax=Paenibacillus baekrokdamisoli TaxID=1712516 RepID=A0A3G9JK44_9BACL|nr:DHH family phosphoesterase [Paenibacillus baekrokdamisoli]MBB3068575.1 c-di-AMP phosphodiesterase-like protein [Paenibacillus baekrokdamisoli]BBH23409.1 cyclic-di-AMP phosphodiesterase GdpP [Paenibacillus baekrokdamisoli]
MPKFLVKRWHGMHHLWAFVLMILLTVTLASYEWLFGLLGLLLSGAVGLYSVMAERAFRRDLKAYLGTISYRVKRAGNEVISELPFGIILYNEDKTVEWHNAFVTDMLERESVVGESLNDLFPMLSQAKEREGTVEAVVGNAVFELMFRFDERLLYVRNITQRWQLAKRYEEEKLALGMVLMDNLEEVTQGMDDQQRATLLSKATAEITEWASKFHVYLKRLTSDRYLVITDQKTLKQLELSRFVILDEVREMTGENKIPMTLSIGFAAGADSIVDLGHWVQTSLDFALGRGGDQAAVKVGQRQSFYGGKSNAVEKRTRVRARVVAHALRDLIKESDNVVIMGHKMPDMDSVGAAIGVLKAAMMFNKEAFIVLEGVNPAIQKMMEMLKEDERFTKRFVTPEQALGLVGSGTLAVVVDTHKASMVKEPKLLTLTEKIVVVDHHRRGEEFINNAILVYMEPYASSTCELVTELLQYIHDRVMLDVRESTALLAGITVDTKSFSLRTGSRTFEAASFLRRNGADSMLIQRMLKEDLAEYIKKADIIKHAEIVYEHIAIAVTEQGRQFSQLLIAQSADTLLNMTDVLASFVIGERQDGLIGISARSLGHMNVQIVMERMGGGGHLTNAAAQQEGTVLEVAQRLKQVLQEIDKEEGLFE